MALPTYPSLSKNPDVENWEQDVAGDPSVVTQAENGVQGSRSRFTRAHRTWAFVYRQLSNTDKETLETFERDTVNYKAGSFTWTHPITAASHQVRFNKYLNFKLEKSLQNQWKVTGQFIED